MSAKPGISHSVWTTVWYSGWNSIQTCIPDGRPHRVAYSRYRIDTVILLMMGTWLPETSRE